MEANEAFDPLPEESESGTVGENMPLRVGLAYNLKKGIQSDVEDIEAEYDSIDTVMAIKEALEGMGLQVILLEADPDAFFKKLTETKVDIVFNIAEGIHGRGREAQVPAILNYLKIPFTGSDETTLCIALDKALAKRVLSTYRIKSPKYQLISKADTPIKKDMHFPLIVKPNAEGSSKGISDLAVVYDEKQLKSLIEKNVTAYGQTMLVEEFISGREFTVALVGNGEDTVAFPPMEIKYKHAQKNNIYSFSVKKNYKEYIEYECPAALDKKTARKMTGMAKNIYTALECKDFSRIDFRMSEEGEIHFIEINPLPGLAPGYSDFPMIAEFNGVDYKSVIKLILNSALKRHGFMEIV